MKSFFEEFKKFIARGNVLDLAVGVIIGGAFTAIVTALTTYTLQPVINWIIALIMGGENALESAVTILQGAYDTSGNIILSESIYIDWGALISSIINFFLIAFILFCIIKVINRATEDDNKMLDKTKNIILTPSEIREMKEKGLDFRKKKDRKKFREWQIEQIMKQKEEKEAQAKLAEEEAKKHTTEYILEEIKDLLKEQNKK